MEVLPLAGEKLMNASYWLSLILLSMLCMQLPCYAQDLSEFMAAFNGADYKQAVSMGEDFIKRYPKHAEARYYLARSYMKSGQLPLAELQLHTALSLDTSDEVRTNCIAALKEISQSNASSSTLSATKSQNAQSNVVPASSAVSTSSNANKGVSNYQSSAKKSAATSPQPTPPQASSANKNVLKRQP
ncbi:MAG: tetratricopeptide repeat protein [Candidatus Obscuribacterales bacterium]|nr:tetratricopeptide repeat protein [Candidatus Obscuribacterales bacterium]